MGASDKKRDEPAMPPTPTSPDAKLEAPIGNTTANEQTEQAEQPPKAKTTMTDNAKARAQNALAYSQRQLDRVVLPETRQRAIDRTSVFANERPLVSSFAAVQLIFALAPLLCFLGFALTSFLTAIAIAGFWVGIIAFVFLLPALCFSAILATFAWFWLLAAYLAYQRVRPYLPEPVVRFLPDGGGIAVRGPDGKQVLFARGGSSGGGAYDPFAKTSELVADAQEGAAEVKE